MLEPFEESRRLTGCNLYFSGPGAALESARGLIYDQATLERWRENIAAIRDALGWPDDDVCVRVHASGVSLAFAAPVDQLYSAVAANEWAWRAALLGSSGEISAVAASGPAVAQADDSATHAPNDPVDADRVSTLPSLQRMAAAEANPALQALVTAAAAHGLPCLPDDEYVSIGTGAGGRTWPIDALPRQEDINWPTLHAIPAALVTGSNGKTTTVRLLAAMLRASGLHVGHSCTEGVYFNNRLVEGGDFSGPGGARAVLRNAHAQAAVLETARGGLLRRGLALCRVDAAVVTNVSADHFGEYGIHTLDDLAAVKLVVARALAQQGLLILNADDPVLRRQWLTPDAGAQLNSAQLNSVQLNSAQSNSMQLNSAQSNGKQLNSMQLNGRLAWFAADFDDPWLRRHRAEGGASCGVREGRLWIAGGRARPAQPAVDLGAVAAMPIALGGRAVYNIANIAAAALAAIALGVAAETIRATLVSFGASPEDNPGRLQSWTFGSARVVLDYAHNPEGLHALLRAVGADAASARLSIVLGHAGNREDDDLRAVAATVAQYRPARVVLKDIRGYERGRASGEIAAIMRQALMDGGVSATAIDVQLEEVQAAYTLLRDLRDGDLALLPLHQAGARAEVVAMLETMTARQWRPGAPLPDRADSSTTSTSTTSSSATFISPDA